MRDTNNCSKDIATEHYMSAAVLNLLRAKVVCVYLPWDDAGEKPAVDVASLPSGILCNRHNAALAPLDDVALQAFGNILDAMDYVSMKSLATKNALYAASGEGLELWLLKLLFGAYHAALAADDIAARKNIPPLDIGIFRKALEGGALAAPRGLYVGRRTADDRQGSEAPHKTDRIRGLRFDISSLECELIVDPAGVDFDAIRRENFCRPSGIDLSGKRRSAHVHLSGPGFAANESARFTLLETRASE
jgi:hypothetical protein